MTAAEANEKGRQALSEENIELAVEWFLKAVELAPDWASAHYNLGLSYKIAHRWEESRDANLKAFRLDPQDDATYWNLAIASGAVGDWVNAELAFRAIGLEIPEGPPPWDFRLGLIPIRVSPDEYPEVVWCHRLDPVRSKIANVPLPDCGRRYGDIVLNDGEPRGYRTLRGREVPVFNELELLQASEYGTYQALVHSKSPEALSELIDSFEREAMYAENWTDSIRMLCRACSEGIPHDHHDTELESEVDENIVRLGIAATHEQKLEEVFENWSGGQLISLERVL